MTEQVETSAKEKPPGFREQLRAFGDKLPDKALFAILFVLWIGLFHCYGNSTLGYIKTSSLFGWMDYAYSNRVDDEHGYFVPMVVLYLIWWKKDELAEVQKSIWWPALILLGAALALHVVGFQVQQTRISIVAFYGGLFVLTGLVWGWRWMQATFFPFFLTAFCVPLGNKADTITQPLRQIATDITATIARGPLGYDVIQNGTTLFDPTGKFSYEVAAACSGLRSLTAISVLALVFAFVWFKPWWKRCIIIAAAVPLAIGSNVFRLLSIVVSAEAFGQDAGNFVHDNGLLSMLPYVPAFIGLALLGWLLDGTLKRFIESCRTPDPEPEEGTVA